MKQKIKTRHPLHGQAVDHLRRDPVLKKLIKKYPTLTKVRRDNLKKIENISHSWKPYRSFASRYLWLSLEND